MDAAKKQRNVSGRNQALNGSFLAPSNTAEQKGFGSCYIHALAVTTFNYAKEVDGIETFMNLTTSSEDLLRYADRAALSIHHG